jgi:hypothetical protein
MLHDRRSKARNKIKRKPYTLFSNNDKWHLILSYPCPFSCEYISNTPVSYMQKGFYIYCNETEERC